MRHIYQPVMIKKLLESNNTATAEEIARVFLNNDDSLLEYYKGRVLTWPKITLKRHKIIKYENKRFTLLLDDITEEQRTKLITMCELRRDEYVDKYQNRYGVKTTRIPIPGPLRFEVLKKTNGVCALCGTTSPLEIDHILPVSLGGW